MKVGAEMYWIGVRSIELAQEDPEDTMQVAVTHRDLAIIALGANLVIRLFPEVREQVGHTAAKLEELAHAQGFLPKPGDNDV